MSPARLQKPEGARGLAFLFVYLLVHLFDCLFTSSLMLSGLGMVPPACRARGTQYSGPELSAHSPAWPQTAMRAVELLFHKALLGGAGFRCLCVVCVEMLHRRIQVWGSAYQLDWVQILLWIQILMGVPGQVTSLL